MRVNPSSLESSRGIQVKTTDNACTSNGQREETQFSLSNLHLWFQALCVVRRNGRNGSHFRSLCEISYFALCDTVQYFTFDLNRTIISV